MKIKEQVYETDAGSPSTTREQKMKKLREGGMMDNDVLMEKEDPLNGEGFSRGGFLKRNNFGDRF